MPEFTILCGVGLLITALVGWRLKTKLFREPAFWINYCIILTFEVLIDGWLTKLSAPIVIYDNDFMTNIRFPWDIPLEDFVFGIPMVVIPLMLWLRSSKDSEEQ